MMTSYILVGMTLALGQVDSGTAPTTQTPPAAPQSAPPINGSTASPAAPDANQPDISQNSSSSFSEKEPHSGENGFAEFIKPKREDGCFPYRLYKAYYDEFFPPKNGNEEESPEPARRALPSPFDSPPFPGSEYQGYPIIGIPPDTSVYPFMKAVYGATAHSRMPLRRARSSSTAG